MSQLRVLISGASIAGPALAYWLVRAGCKVTVVERSPKLRLDGQGVDIRDEARDVIRKMGIFDLCRQRSSNEEGLHFVDKNDRPFASFAADFESGTGNSPSCDIEILRGELANILLDITKDDVKYIFGDTVESLSETDTEVGVSFANGTPTQSFDLVVAADGIGSKVRRLVFGKGSDGTPHIRSLESYIAFFSLAPNETDTMWAKVHWIPGGRYMALRPDNQGQTRVFMGQTIWYKDDERLARLQKAAKEGVAAQKAVMQSLYQDAESEWQTARLLKGMKESDDFYFQHVAQVKLDRWTSPSGRVTVVGDAGYAPSPFTGMGTSLAFLGGYILAGEISKQPTDLRAALESYERVFRPHVQEIQKLAPGVPWIAQPQTALGVKILETCLWTVGKLYNSWVATAASKIGSLLPSREPKFKLPEYEAFEKKL